MEDPTAGVYEAVGGELESRHDVGATPKRLGYASKEKTMRIE